MKIILSLFVSIFFTNVLFAQSFEEPSHDSLLDSTSLETLISAFDSQHYDKVIEKVYIHINKTTYQAGETIYLSGYLVELGSNQLSQYSKILYIDLISPLGEIISRKQFLINGGSSEGSIDLPTTLKPGLYHIRAYTNWMKNFGADYFFYHSFPIYNPLNNQGVTDSLSMEPLDFDIQFFPEGGNSVQGLPIRMGFKAVDQVGNGIYISGEIKDNSGHEIININTRHDGMGSFSFIPEINRSYILDAEWNNMSKKFYLPNSIAEGYVINVNNLPKEEVRILIKPSKLYCNKEIVLVGQCRGTLYFFEKIFVKEEGSYIKIPKSILPEGILQITLFDSKLIPRCERIVYIKKPEHYKLSMEPLTKSIKQRDKVEFAITLVDRNMDPIKNASMSIAINDADQDVKSMEDKAIDSYLLLTSDLKGKIVNPGYYFSGNSREINKDLDLLMLIHGWRRFTWEEIINNQPPEITYNFETGLSISGQAFKEGSDNPLENGMISILSLNNDYPLFRQSFTDENGRFSFEDVLLPDTVQVIAKSVNKSGKTTNIDLEFEDSILYPVDSNLVKKYLSQIHMVTSVKREDYTGFPMDTTDFTERILLKEIIVKGYKINERGKPDKSIKVTEELEHYTDIFQLMKGRIPGLQIQGYGESTMMRVRSFSTSSNPYPLIILDGIPLNASEAASGSSIKTIGTSSGSGSQEQGSGSQSQGSENVSIESTSIRADYSGINSSINSILLAIPPSDVERIDALTTVAATSIYGFAGNNGVILIYTKNGPRFDKNTRTKGYEGFHLPGYNVAREFYSPAYETEDQKLNPYPDFRQTLFWAPDIHTDDKGKIQISFYNSDVCKKMQIDLQGITPEGSPVRFLSDIPLVSK